MKRRRRATQSAVSSFPVRVPGIQGRSYPILTGGGALDELPRLLERLGPPSRLHVVSDRSVWKAWGSRLRRLLAGSGIPFAVSLVPPGEKAKAAPVSARLWSELVAAGCDRRSCVLAFGGGVVGDLAGFAAASILRGIDFVQVPTTLLAMVDASVGGKTGINLPEGKNLVGAFHQPRAVVMDLDLLRTLPEREMRAGWSEVVKTAAILDARLLRFLERSLRSLRAREGGSLRRAVESCARLKAGVVERDEREGGLRMVLNFGHTLAHAIEATRGYGRLLHGEAVAIGMVFASRFGEALGVSRPGTSARIEKLIEAFGLPTDLPRVPIRALLDAMGHDKKRGPRGLRWVLLRRPGVAAVRDGISPDSVRAALEAFAARGRPAATGSFPRRPGKLTR